MDYERETGMIWKRLRGHADLVQCLRRAVGRGRLGHAYAFVGPDGVGKRTFARMLAQCLFCRRCPDADLEACGTCPDCRQVQADTHPDLLIVGCPPGRQELPIEVFAGSRERRGQEGLCHDLALRPMQASRRVAIIDDAHLMNEESANALLKTLEEPPAQALIILLARSAGHLLPTIRSRCQIIRFNRLSESDVAELLAEEGLVDDAQQAARLARLSHGSLAEARQLLEQDLAGFRKELFAALAQDRPDPVMLAEKTLAMIDQRGGDSAAQRRQAAWVVRLTADFYRQALWHLLDAAEGEAESSVRTFLDRFAASTSEPEQRLVDVIERTTQAAEQIDRRAPIPLCLEALFADLVRLAAPHERAQTVSRRTTA